MSKLSSPGWILCCSICKGSFESPLEWRDHLWGKEHQRLSRLACRRWDDTVKECVVVAYFQLPVLQCKSELMSFFSDQRTGRFVTDFLMWTDRPKVAFFQFESRGKVNEIIPDGSLRAEIRLPNQRLQVKRALDMMDLEWEEFMSLITQDDFKVNSSDNDNGNCHLQKKIKLCKRVPSDSTGGPAKIGKLMDVISGFQLRTTQKNYTVQYREICNEVLIPKLEYAKVILLINNLKLSMKKAYPKCKLYIFRHWYLKMWNNGSNELLIFLDTQGILEEDDWNWNSNYEELHDRDILDRTLSQQTRSILAQLGVEKLTPEKLKRQGSIPRTMPLDPYGTWFLDSTTNVVFSLITSPVLVLEIQTCRLLKYLCEFDPRAKSILLIITHWARINGLKFSRSPVTNTANPFIGAEPVALEWLVMLFLCRKRVIPTVRQIIDRPHKKLWINKQDVGFEIDMNFAIAWRTKKSLPVPESDDFVKSVLCLTQEFFKFYSELPEACILNTRDAEVIKFEDFLLHSPKSLTTKLTIDELNLIEKFRTEIQRHPITIISPLHVSSFLSFNSLDPTNREIINFTARKMDGVSFYSSMNNENVDLLSLLSR